MSPSNDPPSAVQLLSTPIGPLAVRCVGAGRPTVVWHSAYVDSHSFDRLLPLLPGRQFVLVDGPGHGSSPPPAPGFALAQCAAAARAVVAAVADGPVDWLGNAWGGHVGAMLAAERDAPLSSLVALCAPMHQPEISAGLRAMLAAFPAVGLRGPMRSGLVSALLDAERRAADPSLEAYVVDAATAPDTVGLVRALRAVVVDRFDLVDRLERIDIPALFVTGDNPLWPVEQARSQAARMPNGRFAHLPGVRHLPQLEDPEGTARLLTDFWASLDD